MRPEWIKTYDRGPHGKFTRLEINQERVAAMELVLGTHNDLDILSNSHFEDCEFVITNPKRVRFVYDRFDRCVFRPKKKVQCVWHENAWYDCTFFGNYLSTHFGSLIIWKDTNPWGDILVRGCDFSQATMHSCYFKRTDVSSVRFPPWPCFTALQPDTNYQQWRPTFESIRRSLMFVQFSSKTEADAVVYHWPTFAEELKIDLPFDEVKARLSALEGILV